MKELTDKKILITGGSSGIGQAIAIACAKEGAQVLVTYTQNQDGISETLAEIKQYNPKSDSVKCNLAETDDISLIAEAVLTKMRGLDILVNNAGTLSRHHSFLDINVADFDLVHAINLRAPFLLTQMAANIMIQQKQGGSIINISSASAKVISPGLVHYECSKAALNALTRGAAAELAKYNIRVNAIEPGLVKTNINRNQWENNSEIWQQRCKKIPLGRSGKPLDIANMAVFLMSEQASWITGALIPVDGGVGSSFL